MNKKEEEKEQMRKASKNLPEDPNIQDNLNRFTVQEHSEWLKYSNDRFRLRNKWDSFFKEWDILICPQMPTDAFPHDQGDYLNRKLTVNNEEQDYFQQVFWAGIITVAHLPSTVFPTGLSKAGLPIGLQAVGAEYNDLKTIDFTRLVAQEIGGFTPPPNYP
jgi:amidase